MRVRLPVALDGIKIAADGEEKRSFSFFRNREGAAERPPPSLLQCAANSLQAEQHHINAKNSSADESNLSACGGDFSQSEYWHDDFPFLQFCSSSALHRTRAFLPLVLLSRAIYFCGGSTQLEPRG